MALEKGVRLLVSAGVSILVARYLGPSGYGAVVFALAFGSFLVTLAGLGMDHYMIKLFSEEKALHGEELGAMLLLRGGAGVVVCLLGLAVLFFCDWEGQRVVLCLIAMVPLLVMVGGVWEAWLKSQGHWKRVAAIQFSGLLVSSVGKLLAVLTDAGVHWIVLAGMIDLLWIAFSMGWSLRGKGLPLLRKIRFESLSRHLRPTTFLLVGSISAIVYMRVDQLMIGELLGEEALGHYGVSVRLVDGWIPILSVAVAHALPSLTREFSSRVEHFSTLFTALMGRILRRCVLIGLCTLIFGKPVLEWLFGEAFSPGGSILVLLIWSLPFVMLSHASWIFYLQKELHAWAAIRLLLGAGINVLLNLWWIPIYGLEGSVWATLLSYAFSAWIFQALHPATRDLFTAQGKAMLSLFSLRSWLNDFRGALIER